MRDYGKVHTSFWSSPTIRSLPEDARTLAIYLLSCPHSTISGAFRLPDGYVTEDLQWRPERVTKGFDELFKNGFATRCKATKWVWVKKHFDWNPPENPNQGKAIKKLANMIPDECEWKEEYTSSLSVLPHINAGVKEEPFRKGLKTVTKPGTGTGTGTGVITSSDEDVVGSKLPTCPHQKIIELYAKNLPELAQPKIWDGNRQQNLAARWKWVLTAKKSDGAAYATDHESALNFFDRFFAYVAKSNFLTGRSKDWQCDLSWLVKANNFAKVIEGAYERKEAA